MYKPGKVGEFRGQFDTIMNTMPSMANQEGRVAYNYSYELRYKKPIVNWHSSEDYAPLVFEFAPGHGIGDFRSAGANAYLDSSTGEVKNIKARGTYTAFSKIRISTKGGVRYKPIDNIGEFRLHFLIFYQ